MVFKTDLTPNQLKDKAVKLDKMPTAQKQEVDLQLNPHLTLPLEVSYPYFSYQKPSFHIERAVHTKPSLSVPKSLPLASIFKKNTLSVCGCVWSTGET